MSCRAGCRYSAMACDYRKEFRRSTSRHRASWRGRPGNSLCGAFRTTAVRCSRTGCSACRNGRDAVTFGSLDATRQLIRYVDRIASIAAEVDAEFVVTLGERSASAPDDLPPNVRITRWVPLNALLRTCAAAIHHGGGTSLTCCALGIPQLVLAGPETAGEAELLRARGVTHVLPNDEQALDAVAIREVLYDDKLHRAAAEIQEEIADLPTPSELLPRLLAAC